jgi:transposase
MQQPMFVRAPSPQERQRLEAGLRAHDVFVVRRCQMLLASARGEHTPQIATQVGCHEQTVRNAIRAFNQRGLAALQARSSRPHTTDPAFDAEQARRLGDLARQSPRAFGATTSVWTLALLAKVAVAQGITDRPGVSGETIRTTLQRVGFDWTRAKGWISSPDPEYATKKVGAIA